MKKELFFSLNTHVSIQRTRGLTANALHFVGTWTNLKTQSRTILAPWN